MYLCSPSLLQVARLLKQTSLLLFPLFENKIPTLKLCIYPWPGSVKIQPPSPDSYPMKIFLSSSAKGACVVSSPLKCRNCHKLQHSASMGHADSSQVSLLTDSAVTFRETMQLAQHSSWMVISHKKPHFSESYDQDKTNSMDLGNLNKMKNLKASRIKTN